LSKYLIQSDKIINPQGLVKKMLMQYRFEPGMSAPKIKIKENQYIDFHKNTTLVVSYETGCTICDNEINQLTDNYKVLKEKGIEVVSIAADHDKNTFENSSKNFLWQKKLCDFNGFGGDNFSNYAIIGAPTMYMIDKEGIIMGKYASVKEIIEYNNR
jgi:peroxiredoxin